MCKPQKRLHPVPLLAPEPMPVLPAERAGFRDPVRFRPLVPSRIVPAFSTHKPDGGDVLRAEYHSFLNRHAANDTASGRMRSQETGGRRAATGSRISSLASGSGFGGSG